MNTSPSRVLFYAGCLIQRFYPEIGHSSVDVLRKNGVDVIVREEKCCGIAAVSSGDMDAARKLARWNIESFLQADVQTIVTSCPTCGMAFKEYPWLFRKEGGEILQQAVDVSHRVHDLTGFLAHQTGFNPPAGELRKRVTYHDPCHLKHAQRTTEEPRRLIQSIRGIEFVEMKRPDLCCGFGGFFSFEHFDLSSKISDQLIDQVLETKAEVVVDACPPCIMKLREGFRRRKITDVDVRHVAEILSAAY